jgi:transposase
VHAVVSERGKLLRHVVTGGEVNDVTQAQALVDGLEGCAVVSDRAYDSDAFIQHVGRMGMEAVVPSRANRKEPRVLDAAAYGQRNVIERLFGRLKQYRRVATRYNKTALSYAGFFSLAASLVALSRWDP